MKPLLGEAAREADFQGRAAKRNVRCWFRCHSPTDGLAMRTLSLVVGVALTVVAVRLSAQTAPSGWRVSLDGGQTPDSTVVFQTMAPGWHLAMGPGGLVYDPGHSTSGRFSVEAEVFLFPGESSEGYGIFVGATAADDGQPAFTGFLLRRDGSAAVIRTDENGRTVYAPWQRNDAIMKGASEEPVRNVLRVDAERDSVRFMVNDSLVATLSRNEVPVDGAFGFRVGRGINLHASTLTLQKRLALPRE